MGTKTFLSAAAKQQNIEASVNHKSQTEATDTIVDKLLTPTKYKCEPVRFVINKDIVTSPYNHKKAFYHLIHYTSIT